MKILHLPRAIDAERHSDPFGFHPIQDRIGQQQAVGLHPEVDVDGGSGGTNKPNELDDVFASGEQWLSAVQDDGYMPEIG
ncbi:hypothetical protein GCM10009095_29980 [Sphingomonas molluscorum]